MKVLREPLVALLGVVVVVQMALRHVFFMCSAWLWGFAKVVPLSEITPWGRWAMADRDGIEPYAMLVIVVLQWLLTALGMLLLARLTSRWRAAAVAGLLAIVVYYLGDVPLKPPLAAVELVLPSALKLVGASLVAVVFVRWTMRQRATIPASLAIALLPFCFVRLTLPSIIDLCAILSPALRMSGGVPLSQVYMQYDLLPSLLAMEWMKLGGDPWGFWVVLAVIFYAALLAVFVIGRRLFSRAELVAPMFVAVVFMRCYAVWLDPILAPQVTPVRLDLWVILVGATLAVGLRHWLVGLLVGALCFFSRSIGVIYLAAYVLAVVADFLAERRDTPSASRAPFRRDLRAVALTLGPSFGLIVAWFLAARLVFGGFSSAAVALYRELGLGMMRVDAKSFYWWLLALTGAVGWLAFSRRASRSPRRAQAAIFAVALMVGNSVYFFGRSHEHNLLNVCVAFVFCAYLGLDLAWPSTNDEAPVVRWLLRFASLGILVVCVYFYSGRAYEKLVVQVQHAQATVPVPASGNDAVPDLHCEEISRAAPDGRVYFFSKSDFWYYRGCHYVPPGYIQPMFLAALQKTLGDELSGLLASGYKVFVPHSGSDFVATAFGTLGPWLPALDATDTASFRVYTQRRAPAAK